MTPADPTPRIIGPDAVVPPGSVLLFLRLAVVLAVVLLLTAGVVFLIGLIRRRRQPRRRRVTIVVRVLGSLGLVAALVAWWLWPPPFFVPQFPALPRLMPADSFAYRSVDDLPVAATSGPWITALGHRPIHAYFGGELHVGAAEGMPFNIADADTPMVNVGLYLYRKGSYPGPFPMTDPAYIQTMPLYHFDDHYLVVDLQKREAWELWMARRWFGRWQADSGAHWSFDSTAYPVGATIAARLPVMPGLVTYADVAAGKVGHVSYAVSPVSHSFTWPARQGDGPSKDPNAPPQGVWMRLKADADLSGLGPQARVVAEGLRHYGTIIVDTAPGFGFYGTPDSRWDDHDLATLTKLTTDDFEVVDPASMIVDPGRLAVKPPG